MKPPLVGRNLLLQQQADLFHALVEAGSALVQRHTEAGEFVREKSPGEADVQAAVA